MIRINFLIMDLELNNDEIFWKIYEFLEERNMKHSAFVLMNEAKLKDVNQFYSGSQFLTIY